MVGVSRRAAAIAGVALSLSAFAASADPLVISNWDGYLAPDAIKSFNDASGNTAELVLHATNEEIMGKLIAAKGKGYDVVFVSSPFAEVLHNLGLAETLDHSKIPNLANLYPEATGLAHDKGNTFSVPYTWGTTGLCYRSDLTPAPASWNDLLKPTDALKGKTTMLATDRWLLAAGFLAQGYSVNETDKAKLAQTRDLLIAAKKTLLAYDDTTFYSKLVSGEAQLVQAWDGWCNYGIAEKPEIKYVVPKEGSDLWVDTMVMVEGSKNKDAAYKFLDYILKADTGKWVVENIMYKTPNKAGMDAIDKTMLDKYPNMAIPPADLLKYEQLRDLGDGMKTFSKVVTEITSSK